MKLVLKVKFGKRIDTIDMPIGEGKQNFLWLGHAAATMYVVQNAPAMKAMLGRSVIPGAVTANTQLFPVNIYSDMCTFYHPSDFLMNELEDGQIIMVDLVDRFEVDIENGGTPKLTKWAFIAYRPEPQYEQERLSLVKEKLKEREDYLRVLESQNIARRLERDRPRIAQMKYMLREQLFDQEIVTKVALAEWKNIEASVVLEKTVPKEADQQVLRGLMIKHHPDISALFKFFSAINSGGCTDTVEYIEYNKFFIETKVFGEGDHSSTILRIFVESQSSAERKGGSVNVHSEMKRHEFFLSLVKVALYKYVTLEKRRIAKLKKMGLENSYSHGDVPSPPQAFERLFAEYLKPSIVRIGGLMVREYIGSDEILLFLHEKLEGLAAAFNFYSEIKGKPATEQDQNPSEGNLLEAAIAPSGLMTLKGFARFVSDGCFSGSFDSLHGMDEDAVLSATNIRQIFSASQHDWFENSDEILLAAEADAGKSRRHQQMMSFAEFVEAIIRVALASKDEVEGTSENEGKNRVKRAVLMACATGKSQSGL